MFRIRLTHSIRGALGDAPSLGAFWQVSGCSPVENGLTPVNLQSLSTVANALVGPYWIFS